MLDLPRRELHQALHLDLVDDGVEDLLARAVALADENLDDHALLVLRGLVAEADRGGLSTRPQLVGDDGRVEVEGVHRGGIERHEAAASYGPFVDPLKSSRGHL